MRSWLHNRRCAGLAFALLVIATAPAQSAQPSASPPPTSAQLIASLGFADGDVGFVLVDVHSGQVIEEKAADQLFMPASVAKLATAYAAKQILGPDYRFSTSLYRRGANVYLQGGGDPVLSANDLQALAAELRAAKAGGAGGRFFYDEGSLAPLPEVSDRQPIATAYNAGLGALNVDFNRIEVTWVRRSGVLTFQARSIADGLIVPVDWVSFAPSPGNLPQGVQFIYAGDGKGDRWQYSKLLPDRGDTFLPVRGTALHTALVLRQLALAAGVALASPEPGHVPTNGVALGRIDSPPLSEILIGLLRYSNNFSAELIGLTASRKLTGRALSLVQSSQALTDWLEGQAPGTDWRGFHLENHSGLDSRNRMTPRQMASLLALVARDSALMAVLPPREDNGEIAAAPKNGNVRLVTGKSGTMDYARALAGFFPAQDGRPLAFAIFIFDAGRRAALDASMDRRIIEPSPEARSWTHRARALDDALIKAWMAKF